MCTFQRCFARSTAKCSFGRSGTGQSMREEAEEEGELWTRAGRSEGRMVCELDGGMQVHLQVVIKYRLWLAPNQDRSHLRSMFHRKNQRHPPCHCHTRGLIFFAYIRLKSSTSRAFGPTRSEPLILAWPPLLVAYPPTPIPDSSSFNIPRPFLPGASLYPKGLTEKKRWMLAISVFTSSFPSLTSSMHTTEQRPPLLLLVVCV